MTVGGIIHGCVVPSRIPSNVSEIGFLNLAVTLDLLIWPGVSEEELAIEAPLQTSSGTVFSPSPLASVIEVTLMTCTCVF